MRFESGFAAIVLSVIAAFPCAATERIEATYDFVWNGFQVAAAETVTEFTQKRYFLGIELRTHGLLKMATGAKGDIKVSGQILPGGQLQPREFSASGVWKGDPFLQRLNFTENGAVSSAEAKRPDKWIEKNKRHPVPDALKRGPDPTSLFVSLMQKPLNGNDVIDPITLRTYDGETVMDWQLGCSNDVVKLKKTRHSPHHGEAIECQIASTLVAGARIKEDKSRTKIKRGPRGRRRPVERTAEDDQTRVWLMAFEESGQLLPVRAEVPSDQGTVNMYLSKLTLETGR